MSDWTSYVHETSYERKNSDKLDRIGQSLTVAVFLPNTPLYRGGNESYEATTKLKVFNRSGPTWFSNQVTAEIYGPARKFTLMRPITLLNMGDCGTIYFLKALFEKENDTEALQALKTAFQIREQGNGTWSCKCVTRLTEHEEDHLLADKICKYFKRNGLQIDGWYHLRLAQGSCDGTETVAPEIMICDPPSLILYGDPVKYEGTRLYTLQQRDKKSKPKTKTVSRLNEDSGKIKRTLSFL